MSLSINPVQPVKVIDPVLDFDQKQYYAVLKGGQRTSYKPIISTSYSNSSATFSAPPPSPSVAVSRKVKLLQPVTIDFTGTATGSNLLLLAGSDALRAYPLSSVMNSVQLDLNNTSFSINMSDTIQALLRYHNPDNLKDGDLSMTPSTLDKSQQYSDLNGSIRNPLAAVIDAPNGGLDPRGAFPSTVYSNTATDASVSYNIVEDIFLSPLLFGTAQEDTGFIGLQTFQLTINWAADLSRIWCHSDAGGSTLDSITVTLGQPTLLFEYKTPPIMSPVPVFKRYPYYEIQRYPTELGAALLPDTETVLNSSNIQLNSIPRMIYVYVRKRNSDLDYTDTDTFCSIERISVNWANHSGLLSNASKYDLYEMSKRNGCNLNWRDWSGEASNFTVGDENRSIHGAGSVLAIEMGTDICLNPDEAPGVNGTYQLQLDVSVINQSNTAYFPALYVVISNEGIFTIENNSAYSQIGVISREDVLGAEKDKAVNYNDLKYYAGASIFKNFGRKLKNTIKAIGRHAPGIIKETIKTAKQVAPYIPQILKLAEMMGGNIDDGMDAWEEQTGMNLVGGARSHVRKKYAGMAISGGVLTYGGASARGMM